MAAAASTATVLSSPLSHSKGGERATSSEWARAGSDTAREGGKEGRAGKRIATSRPSTVCPPPSDRDRGQTASADPPCRSWALRFSLLLIPTCVRVAHTKSAQAAKREQCLYVDLFHSFLLPKHVATMDDERERAFCARMYLLLRVANAVFFGGIGLRRQSVRSPVSRLRSCSDDVLLCSLRRDEVMARSRAA